MLSEIKGWGWLVALGVNLLGLWAGWSLKKKFTAREDCEARHGRDAETIRAVHKALSAMESRHAATDARLDHVPATAAVHELQLAVEQLRGEVRTLKAENAGIKDILLRVENNVTLLVRGHLKD